MRVIEWQQFLEADLPFDGSSSAVTVGVFDGVHRGHKALIESIVSHNVKTIPVVVTFRLSQYRKTANGGKEYPGDILSFRQKMLVFENLGVSVTIVVEFSESFKRMGGVDFLRILQQHGSMGFMALGSNFRCGYGLDTDADAIKKYNAGKSIQTCVIQPLKEGSQPISSSYIRDAISRGKLSDASFMLGRPFTLDLCGASIFLADKLSGTDIVCDIAAQGLILPPPGRYSAFLYKKKNRQSLKKPVEVLVEKGKVIISGDSADGKACLEYLEFLAL
jgi:riboflavin kinase/FMN adenylyltransferase